MNKLALALSLFFIPLSLTASIVEQLDWVPSSVATEFEIGAVNASAALITSDKIRKQGNGQLLASGMTLQEIGFCADEQYANELSVSYCSSALVAPDVMLTAAHCLDELSCQNDINFVFDFNDAAAKASPANTVQIKETNLYRCEKVLFSSKQSQSDDDFALIKLDRPVSGRVPVAWRRSGEVSLNDDLFSVTNPYGTSQKIARGKVTSVSDENGRIASDYDAVSGQSGSPVFGRGGTLEGIHKAAYKDVKVSDRSEPCYQWLRFSAKKASENARITPVSIMREKLNQFASPNPEAGEGEYIEDITN